MNPQPIQIGPDVATIDENARRTLAVLADVIIPSSDGFPSGSAAGAAGELLDAALQARPDRMRVLVEILAEAADQPPMQVVTRLHDEQSERFAVLVEAITGAYFLNPAVLEAFGYQGQRPVPIVPDETDYQDLLPEVLSRGVIYRATPTQPNTERRPG